MTARTYTATYMSLLLFQNLREAIDTDMNIRTPAVYASMALQSMTDARVSEVIDTFRLFIDSMDFLEGYGDGERVLGNFFLNAYGFSPDENLDAKSELFLRILRLSSFEMKTNFVKERYARLLYRNLDAMSYPN